MVKLDTSEDHHKSLLETMYKFNEACNYIAETAFSIKSANKAKIQQLVYREVRNKFGLSAQLTIRAIAKTAEAYKRDKTIKPKFKPSGAIVYDQRILSWKGLESVSILSLNGRLKVPIRIGEYQSGRMERVRGQADLILKNGRFYLAVVVEAPEQSKFDAIGTLGIDLGIVNIAVDNDGTTFSGKQIDESRERYAKLRGNLQKTGTESAKRHLKTLSGRESRFHRDINHIEYKATLSGVPVILVNPRGTSHTCPECGHNEKANRPNRDTFKCVQCGFSGNADLIAAINIAARAAVNQPIIACDDVKAILGNETEHSYKPLSGALNMPPISNRG